jgi:class 3 adenylate cyclase
VPTLVLHRRDDAAMSVEHGRYLAAHIPNAKYVELPGADDLYWVGDTDRMLDEIEEFLTGVRRERDTDRVLATVLFGEVVGSKEQHRLERYIEAATRELERFRGRRVPAPTDRLLATFDGPVRAVACAQAIRNAATELGLDVRTGLHIGEVDVRGEDAGGTTFEIAAEVAGLAKPRQVLISRTVLDVVVGSGIATADRGEHVIRGVPGSWRLYSVED